MLTISTRRRKFETSRKGNSDTRPENQYEVPGIGILLQTGANGEAIGRCNFFCRDLEIITGNSSNNNNINGNVEMFIRGKLSNFHRLVLPVKEAE